MSKPVKDLLRKELVQRFEGVKSLAIVGLTGVDGVTNSDIRRKLLDKDIRLTVVKNSLARQAFKELDLAGAAGLLNGPCAVAYGADSIVEVVRELLALGKEAKNLQVKAALLEGDVFGADRIEELSKYPTRDEAIGRVVACMLSPAGRLAACALAPGAAVAGVLKTIEEKGESDDESAEAA